MNLDNWQQQAYQYQIENNYAEAISLYEGAIQAEPEVKSYYWHLGLLLLLQGKEAEAQTTWLMAMMEGESEVEQLTEELIQLLQAEAQRQEAQGDDTKAWLVRQHIRENQPTNLENLLHLIRLEIRRETFTSDELHDWEVISLLKAAQPGEVNADLLLPVLQDIFQIAPPHPASLELAEASLAHLQQLPDCVAELLSLAMNVGYTLGQATRGASLVELCLRLEPENTEVMIQLAALYQNTSQYGKGIEIAKQCYSLLKSEELPERVFAYHLLLRGLMSAGGYWEEANLVLKEQESLLLQVIQEQPIGLDAIKATRLLSANFFFPYFRDDLQRHRTIQNQIAQLCQANIQIERQEEAEKYRQILRERQKVAQPNRRLKVGYLSHCFRQHSVGWLARWLFQHHNRERFQIYLYFVNYKQKNEPLQEWYVNQADQAHKFDMDSWEIAEQISKDEIDILIDLDSITLDLSCHVMALKPAPIQVTWLGWDALGMPAIDYFIADPYVLPASAQEYYPEKIWRLPNTYIAVDGFEVGVPTLRRDDLDIPVDAVVYLSGQRGYKRHLDTARLQLKIIKEVPNSYFLIKGTADEESIKSFFNQLAEEEGVDCSRLRFLPDVPAESIHRANLAIADIVLDTYPYNGATTTLETLWMCVPLVTRVGEQFAARNSYTMMMNAGITEGIAWTDEEYVEWGVRLGKDEMLRQQISWKLRQSRQTAPLWNAKQFTREMEKAYQQMWQRWQRIV